jgi:hypothetical protein
MFKMNESRPAMDYHPNFSPAHNDLKGEIDQSLRKLKAIYQRFAQ